MAIGCPLEVTGAGGSRIQEGQNPILIARWALGQNERVHVKPALKRGRGRPAVASQQIADDLRQQCLRGGLRPGARLPRREELLRRYAASATTIQQAINLLVADGLVEARGRAGTFVAARPPHLTDIGLVFPARRDNPYTWRHFYDVLAASAALWRGDQPRRFLPYCCPPAEPVGGDWQRLRDDIQHLRLSGVIHATSLVEPDLAKWQEQFHTPSVVLAPSHVQPGTQAAVLLSYDSFFSRAIEFLAQRGRRRAAVVLNPELYFHVEQQHIDREAARWGVEIRPMWRQFVGLGVPVAARSVTHLLLGGPAEDRPEGLIVADDNLVSQSIQGVHDAGVRPGAALDVVVHANFPDASPAEGDGITRLGFDSRAILAAAVRLIDAWRESGQVTGPAEVPAVFQEELWKPAEHPAATVATAEQ